MRSDVERSLPVASAIRWWWLPRSAGGGFRDPHNPSARNLGASGAGASGGRCERAWVRSAPVQSAAWRGAWVAPIEAGVKSSNLDGSIYNRLADGGASPTNHGGKPNQPRRGASPTNHGGVSRGVSTQTTRRGEHANHGGWSKPNQPRRVSTGASGAGASGGSASGGACERAWVRSAPVQSAARRGARVAPIEAGVQSAARRGARVAPIEAGVKSSNLDGSIYNRLVDG